MAVATKARRSTHVGISNKKPAPLVHVAWQDRAAIEKASEYGKWARQLPTL